MEGFPVMNDKEFMTYIEKTISYMNYCKRIADETFNYKYFTDHIVYTERFLILKSVLDDLLKFLDLELVEEGGIYKPVMLTKKTENSSDSTSYLKSVLEVTWDD